MKPWEKYAQQQPAPAAAGPWQRYAQPPQAQSWLGPTSRPSPTPEDPAFSSEGVPSYKLRAALSFMDTPAEQDALLERKVGKDGFTRDKGGRLALTPAGLEKMGMPKSDRPVLIDKPGFTSLSEFGADIADYSGSVPEVLGAVGTGMAASGAGFFPGVAAAGLGAAAGKAGTELAEQFAGANQQSLPEVTKDVAQSAVYGAVGEGVGRGIGAGVRKAFQPYIVPEERLALAREATQMGAQPMASQVIAPGKARLYKAAEWIAKNLGGDPVEEQNRRVLMGAIDKLRGVGRPADKVRAGQMVTDDLMQAKEALKQWSEGAFGKLNEELAGRPVVPTRQLKAEAKKIFGGLTKDPEGNVTLAPEGIENMIGKIMRTADEVPLQEAQSLTDLLYQATSNRDLLPGISGGYAKRLHAAATGMFRDIPGEMGEKIRFTRAKFERRAKMLDEALIHRVLKDPSEAGRLEPEEIVGAFFKKDKSSKLARMSRVLSPSTMEEVRKVAMDDVLKHVLVRGKDPLQLILDGESLLKALDNYGDRTLRAMFGKETAFELRRLGQVTAMVAPREGGAGTLITAGIAASPMGHPGALTQAQVLSRVLAKPKVVRYLTEGMRRGPRTEDGAALINRFIQQYIFTAEQVKRDYGAQSPLTQDARYGAQ